MALVKFLCVSALVTASLTIISCNKSETLSFAPPPPPKAEPKSINPDDFLGCKRECLKGRGLCVMMSAEVFGKYEKDLEKLFSDAGKIPTGEESQIGISEDSFLDTKYMTILAAQGIRVRQGEINDPDLEILSINNSAQPIFKFKSDVIDKDYGGAISRIQFHQGLPIFTLGGDRCVGVL